MNYLYPDTIVQVFCKAPVAGTVKTRLMTHLTAQQAAELHIELTLRLLKLLFDAQICPIQLWCSPDIEHPFFQAVAKEYNLSLQLQKGEGLGVRMHNALSLGLETYKNALLIGCDCASLTIQDFYDAIEALNQKTSLVLAPTEDGGYILIGVNQPHKEILEDEAMPWGTAEVLNITRQRIQQQGVSHYEIKQQWDIDEIEDLERYKVLTGR